MGESRRGDAASQNAIFAAKEKAYPEMVGPSGSRFAGKPAIFRAGDFLTC